ncbi:hypothetical protein M408DRAFT_321937 [Serendipita vermifera MAFF 305830]|uniref:Uncharacterized protein n=1 Tax=Serendipita vermifera MAFF 305830 TaxID=933852 RepID=A0A0C3B271_SERVB|nr:hypothetical protein M408DRAFT_321937 [Serendipita vermifera MAFF 305830]
MVAPLTLGLKCFSLGHPVDSAIGSTSVAGYGCSEHCARQGKKSYEYRQELHVFLIVKWNVELSSDCHALGPYLLCFGPTGKRVPLIGYPAPHDHRIVGLGYSVDGLIPERITPGSGLEVCFSLGHSVDTAISSPPGGYWCSE